MATYTLTRRPLRGESETPPQFDKVSTELTMRLTSGILIASLLFAGIAHRCEAADGNRKWDFESEKLDMLPSGFVSAVGDWSVALDEKNHVLYQNARNADAVFNLLIRTDVLYSDLEASVRQGGQGHR